MDFGDIYFVEIPISGGHEQSGVRPAIIVQTPENIEKIPTILVVPFTTQIKASNFPFTFIVEPDATNNLSSRSVALVFQLRAIDKKRLQNKLSKLISADTQTLKQSLEKILNI